MASIIDYERITQEQWPKLITAVNYAFEKSPFYRERLGQAGFQRGDLTSIEDLARLPFTTKEDLRAGYPLGLMAADEKDVVRIHSSSGTTGKPVIVPYTQKDVLDWAVMMARALAMAGVTSLDRVQVTPGYGLWTAGTGFQAGVEQLGAMAIPTGPGNTEKQLEMMTQLKTTVLIGTSSYGLLLAEEAAKRGLLDQLHLRLGIFGSERWGNKMRQHMEELLDIQTFDIYGLTEIYGPGIAIDCAYHQGLHYWHDFLYFEIIDPVTGKVLPPGQEGELVITTLTKEGMPLIRFRTRDLTRLVQEACPCGSPYPMMKRLIGRSDDMFKIKGVNIFPGQIDQVLSQTKGALSEYQIILERREYKDHMCLKVEIEEGYSSDEVAASCRSQIKSSIGILAEVTCLPQGSLPRSEKKTKRLFDYR
ncbi:phenylacetate--CoA ligase family protein [Heliorestis convoluta]|uniref:Phenylacetate-coenzyme A ligase n=1 Tax=Heliorestis convoluta TaxID=356322 RepID=A0A5Q2N7A4_9FIRM|nr:phenylacetate--CoA ligase [Heliorestis convoluta]QGG49436.1 phenylacetate-CoA ligase [Heliorestis convoluta]